MLRMGLEAASIILFIVTSPGVDRRALNEDAIEAAISLMRLHLAQNLVPALNQTGHLAITKTLDNKSHLASPSRKRRRSSAGDPNNSNAKHLKKLYKHILSNTVHLQILLMERLQQLVESLPLDDQQILLLTNGVLPALQIETASTSTATTTATPVGQQLQLASIAVCTAAFRRYPMHRDSILEDLFPVMLQLPTGKRSLRTFPLPYASALNASVMQKLVYDTNHKYNKNGEEPRYIQMMSALVLSLVQACVQRPAYTSTTKRDDVEDDDNSDHDQDDTCWTSGLRGCQAVVETVVDALLQRCGSRGKTGISAIEFRPVLTHLVQDLLTTLLVPEFPAADLVLSVLTSRLLQDVGRASAATNSKQGAPEATYLTVAFDALGKIFAVQARILAVQSDRGLALTTRSTQRRECDLSCLEDIPLACYCQSSQKNALPLIGCEQCQTFFHAMCVGIVASSSTHPDEDWYCDGCRLGRILERERRKHAQHGNVDYLDESYAVHHVFQATLAHRLGATGIEAAKQFHLARWLDALQLKKTTRKLTSQLLEYWDTPGPTGEVLTEEGSHRAIIYLATKGSPLILSFRSQIRFVLKLMEDNNSHSLRKLSLKTIEKVR